MSIFSAKQRAHLREVLGGFTHSVGSGSQRVNNDSDEPDIGDPRLKRKKKKSPLVTPSGYIQGAWRD